MFVFVAQSHVVLSCSAGETGEEGTSGGSGAVSYPPPPNCRIREVHCGNQVRLIVIAIRDIAKGEEITVDYSLTEWGENAVVGVTMTMASTSELHLHIGDTNNMHIVDIDDAAIDVCDMNLNPWYYILLFRALFSV